MGARQRAASGRKKLNGNSRGARSCSHGHIEKRLIRKKRQLAVGKSRCIARTELAEQQTGLDLPQIVVYFNFIVYSIIICNSCCMIHAAIVLQQRNSLEYPWR